MKIKLTNTLYEYDGPLSSFAEIDGCLHYGQVSRDEQTWIFAAISHEAGRDIVADLLPIRDVFLNVGTVIVAEGGPRVENESWRNIRTIPVSEIPGGWLPDAGVYLHPRRLAAG